MHSMVRRTFIANVGDVNPTNGAKYVYRTKHGVYIDVIEPQPDDRGYLIYTFTIDQYKRLPARHDCYEYVVPNNYTSDWPFPAVDYQPWWLKYIDSIASTVGRTAEEVIDDLCSDDPATRAIGYDNICATEGAHQFDCDPLFVETDAALIRRYKPFIRK